MFSFRRLALLVALGLPAAPFVFAQDSTQSPSSSSNPPTQQTEQQTASDNSGAQSVQVRIRGRRAARRAAAIKDVYSHLYEVHTGMGYLRFKPGDGTDGKGLQRTTFYAWEVDFTRYYSQRFGVTLDGRGYYGTAFVGLNPFSLTRPAISTYDGLGGITYRFYMQPKYSVSVRGMGGFADGHFSGDTGGLGAKTLGLWDDGVTFAGSGAVIGEYNVTPGLGLRLAPEYFITGFGSSLQASRGFTAGFVFRFGKQ
jgi:hypothetical protein